MAATLTPQAPSRPASDRGRRKGLYGHSFDTTLLRVTLAESLGTFVLVLTIVSTAVAATLAKPIAGVAYESLAIPIAGGITLAFLAATLGPISGAHLNPAVTLGLAINRKFPLARLPAYVSSQVVGALGAALVAWCIYGQKARTVAHLGSTQPAAGVGIWRAFVVEMVATFVLVLVIVAAGARAGSNVGPVAIGSALAAAIFVSGPISGAALNPARALGSMIVASRFVDWWIYIVAPLLGATLAASTAGWLVGTEHASSEG